jgi:hypothetical protein
MSSKELEVCRAVRVGHGRSWHIASLSLAGSKVAKGGKADLGIQGPRLEALHTIFDYLEPCRNEYLKAVLMPLKSPANSLTNQGYMALVRGRSSVQS